MVYLSVTKDRDHVKPYLFPHTLWPAFPKKALRADIGRILRILWTSPAILSEGERRSDRNRVFLAREPYHIVSDELGKLIADDKREPKSKHKSIVQQKKMLRTFLEHLTSIDQWNVNRTKDEILAEKESEIKELKEIVVQLIKEARKLETDGFIDIPKGYVLTVVDLFS